MHNFFFQLLLKIIYEKRRKRKYCKRYGKALQPNSFFHNTSFSIIWFIVVFDGSVLFYLFIYFFLDFVISEQLIFINKFHFF